MKRKLLGFTLIELIVVIALIAIVTGIGVPAYQTQSTKTQVSDVVSLITKIRSQLEVVYNSTGRFPAPEDFTQANHGYSTYCVDAGRDNARVTVAVTKGSEAGNLVMIQGRYSSTTDFMEWFCGSTEIDAGLLPSACRDDMSAVPFTSDACNS